MLSLFCLFAFFQIFSVRTLHEIIIKAESIVCKYGDARRGHRNVRRLENLTLFSDEQANIEAPPASITYICDFDTNFGDKEAFITGIARYMEEAGLHQRLVC